MVSLHNSHGAAHSVLGQLALHGLDAEPFNAWDAVQFQLGCCGFSQGPNDWLTDWPFNWTEPVSRGGAFMFGLG